MPATAPADVCAEISLTGPWLSLQRGVGGRRGIGPVVIEDGVVWRAARCAAGPATVSVFPRCEWPDGAVTADVLAWGPGAPDAVEGMAGLLGAADDPGALVPRDPVVRDLLRRHTPPRFGATGTVWEHVIPAVLAQKVQSVAARRAWQFVLRHYGETPPGPAPARLRLPPTPERMLAAGYAGVHEAAVERRRFEVVTRVARVAARIEEAVPLGPAEVRRRLETVRGVGPWTSALITQASHGDADAVLVGDYHLPALIGWVFTGRAGGDDAQMLRLLEPYRGQRARLQLLVKASRLGPPRRGPRLPLPDWQRR
jgi:3-methyladenine DNA glycosylase/8-oxoguanine DNA glycosylase